MQLMTNSTRKRPHEKPSVDIRLIVFIINRSILRTIQDTRIFHKKTDDNGPCAKFIEFASNEIFRSDESNISSFFLYYLKHETLNHTDGLSINGQLRGMSTRILINVSVWKSFKIPDLAQHYSRFGNERVAKLVPVMTSEVEVCAVIERYETATLKRILSQKNSHSKMCSHITKLYELIEESKQVILIAKKEKSDMMDSISSFETEIRQLRREIEGWKHKSSGNKSVITKELNWLALETVYRNQEWVRCQGILKRNAGINKMIATKNESTLRREKQKIDDSKIVQSNENSLPLVVFENIKKNLMMLTKYNSYETIKAILSNVLSVVIPPIDKRKEGLSSNHAISNLFGLNNK